MFKPTMKITTGTASARGYTPPRSQRGMAGQLELLYLLGLQRNLRAKGVSLAGGNKYVPPHGARELARRLRQGKGGDL